MMVLGILSIPIIFVLLIVSKSATFFEALAIIPFGFMFLIALNIPIFIEKQKYVNELKSIEK